MNAVGKALLVAGLLIAAVGAALLLAGCMGWPLGRLPGDFAWRGRRGSIFFPLGTSILVSLVLSVVLYLISIIRR